MRQEHQAGEKLFVDFPGDRLPIYDRRTGEAAIGAEPFVAVMGASNFLHAKAVASQRLESTGSAPMSTASKRWGRCRGSWCATTCAPG